MSENVYRGYAKDVYTEPTNVDPDTLKNLGPLRPMAGLWRGAKGWDVNPKADGPETQAFVERFELQPIDPQTNGPQLFYGLRYHQHVVKPGEIETYHDQIGYWLWEPATGLIIQTLSIPRGQTAMAAGKAAADAKQFELVASRGVTTNGILSNPFLEEAFRTDEYRIRITIHDDETWSYDETTVLVIKGEKRFEHTDKSVLVKIGEATPNPLALAARAQAVDAL
jgi:hypothetical protein